jgi:hypothetical protein
VTFCVRVSVSRRFEYSSAYIPHDLILNLKQILLGDLLSGMLQPLNQFQGLSKHTTHCCFTSCSFRGDRIQRNFLGQTAGTRREGFPTFREITAFPSSECAFMACYRVNFNFTFTFTVILNILQYAVCDPLNIKTGGTFRVNGVLVN